MQGSGRRQRVQTRGVCACASQSAMQTINTLASQPSGACSTRARAAGQGVSFVCVPTLATRLTNPTPPRCNPRGSRQASQRRCGCRCAQRQRGRRPGGQRRRGQPAAAGRAGGQDGGVRGLRRVERGAGAGAGQSHQAGGWKTGRKGGWAGLGGRAGAVRKLGSCCSFHTTPAS